MTIKDNCVDCCGEFVIGDLSHVWMDYDPEDLEEGDEESTYVGLHCAPCLQAASELCDMPIINLNDADSIIEGFGLAVTDEEEIA